MQDSYEGSLGSDEQYTERINSNQYSEAQFMSDSGGYGLAQWTSSGRKQGLYRFVKDKGVGIDDENAQVEYLIGELTPGGNGYATYQLMTYNGYSPSDWINAESVEEATIAFCWTFERPGTPNMQARIDAALSYYEQFKDSEKPGGDGRIGDISLSGDDATKMSEMLTDGLRMADDDSYIYVYIPKSISTNVCAPHTSIANAEARASGLSKENVPTPYSESPKITAICHAPSPPLVGIPILMLLSTKQTNAHTIPSPEVKSNAKKHT